MTATMTRAEVQASKGAKRRKIREARQNKISIRVTVVVAFILWTILVFTSGYENGNTGGKEQQWHKDCPVLTTTCRNNYPAP